MLKQENFSRNDSVFLDFQEEILIELNQAHVIG